MPPQSKFHVQFGQAVKAIREEKKLTQSQVSAKMQETPATYVSDIERAVRNPSLKTLKHLADALGVPLSQIFKRAEK